MKSDNAPLHSEGRGGISQESIRKSIVLRKGRGLNVTNHMRSNASLLLKKGLIVLRGEKSCNIVEGFLHSCWVLMAWSVERDGLKEESTEPRTRGCWDCCHIMSALSTLHFGVHFKCSRRAFSTLFVRGGGKLHVFNHLYVSSRCQMCTVDMEIMDAPS